MNLIVRSALSSAAFVANRILLVRDIPVLFDVLYATNPLVNVLVTDVLVLGITAQEALREEMGQARMVVVLPVVEIVLLIVVQRVVHSFLKKFI